MWLQRFIYELSLAKIHPWVKYKILNIFSKIIETLFELLDDTFLKQPLINHCIISHWYIIYVISPCVLELLLIFEVNRGLKNSNKALNF